MRRYEGDVAYAAHSDVRYRRALSWLATGSLTAESLRAAISDHRDAPDSICRHLQSGSHIKTVFWCIANVTVGEITYGRGNPCDSTALTSAMPLTDPTPTHRYAELTWPEVAERATATRSA